MEGTTGKTGEENSRERLNDEGTRNFLQSVEFLPSNDLFSSMQ